MVNNKSDYVKTDDSHSFPDVPERENSVKDVPFLILFGIFLFGFIYLSSYGFTNGQPEIYIDGYDSWGNVCGKKSNPIIPGVPLSGRDQSDRKFVFDMGLSSLKTALAPFKYLRSNNKPAVICVEKCPESLTNCRELLEKNGYRLSESVIQQHVCVMEFGLILEHFEFFNRCIPKQLVRVVFEKDDSSIEITDSETEDEEGSLISQVRSSALTGAMFFLTSMRRFWRDGLLLSAVPVVLCFAATVSFRLLSRVVVMIVVVIFGLGSVLVTVYLWFSYIIIDKEFSETNGPYLMENALGTSDLFSQVENQVNNSLRSVKGGKINENIAKAIADGFTLDDLKVYAVDTSSLFKLLAIDGTEDSDSLLGWTIFFTVGTVIFVLILIWLRKSFVLVVRLFDEASSTAFSIPMIFVQPIFTLIFVLCVLIHFFAASVYLISILTPDIDKRGFVTYVNPNTTSLYGLLSANLLGTFWLWEYAYGCEQFIIAGAVSHWYFSSKDYIRFSLCPTLKPIAHLISFHLGTIAIGSLVIAILDYMKVVLHYINSRLKNTSYDITKNTAAAITCCVHCTEKILRFANKNAFICSAIYGFSFWESGKKGLSLLIGHAEYTLVINIISFLFLLLAKLVIVILSGGIAYVYFKVKYGSDVTTLEYGFVIFLISAYAFVVARCFFSVYDVLLDTLFICFCDDLSRNDGVNRPYSSSKQWRSVMKDLKSEPNKTKRKYVYSVQDSNIAETYYPSSSYEGTLRYA